MTGVVDFLLELRELGVTISVEGDRLLIEAPPGTLTPEHRDALAANKSDIIRLLGAQNDRLLAELERGNSLGVTSRAQRSIWLLERLNPGTAAWNIGAAFAVDGPLDRDALERSFQTILARHATLRSRFIENEGVPTVETPVHDEWKIDYRDLRGEPEPGIAADAVAVQEAQRPFDLTLGPLLRVVVLRTGETTHLVAMVLHHIAADGWSLGVIAQELGDLYKRYAAGDTTPLPSIEYAYSDFVTLETAQDATADADVAWWRERLAGDLPTVRLSRDAAAADGRGRRVSFELPGELRAAIEATARAHDATPFMLLLTAFILLVHRLSGERDVLISTPTSNRERREFANLVGMFVNPIVLRTTVDDDMSAVALLERVRTASLESFAHPVSFDRVVEAVHPERRGTQTPIVQLSFAYQNITVPELRLGDAVVERRSLELVGSRFEISLEIWPTANGLACNFEYASNLFDAPAIARLMDQYRTVLEAIVADPGVQVSHVPLLSDAEREQLLVAFNDTAAPYRSDATIHELVSEQAARTPDAPAVVDAQRQLSYRELDERASRLANHLRSLGVGPEVLVGMCVDRSVEMVVAMLGILKAGGAYVPIDPVYPDDRVRFMLDDTRAPVLVKQTRRGDALPYEGTVVDLDADAAAIAQHPASAPQSGATADNLAYIIYTSGSTGRPKGTMMRHSAVSLVDWAQHTYEPAELARSIAASSVCFDFSVFEIFVPLCSGGAVLVAEDALHLPDLSFAPSMISTVPSALAELARGGRIPATVRTINSGGELLTNALAQELYRTTNVQRVINVYGPTEYTTLTTTAVVERDSPHEPAIGRPLRNTQLYVLDPHLQLLPIGAVGELYIAGDGLARGYWNQPELTAERFVPNPFGPPRSRMYKTGDHVRWRADGELEFVGRIDHQIKLRGFRIELGEIESALLRYPGVREAVVVLRRDHSEDARLAAYVAADPGTVDVAELRASAKAWLPGYMVPQEFMLLPVLPRNPSGKVDRAALPRPEKAGAAPFDAIHNPLELAVVGTFCDVLGVEQLSPTDNFFDAGGHSLLAVKAANRLARVLGQPVSALSVFQAPTAKELAALLDHDLRAADRHISVLQPLGDEPPLFCFHDVFSRPVHYLSLVRHLEPRQPVYGIATAQLEPAVIANPSFDMLVRAYTAEIKRTQPQGPYRVCGYSLGGMLAFEVGRALVAGGDEALVVLFDTYMTDRGVLSRAAAASFLRALVSLRRPKLMLALRKINWARRLWVSEMSLRSVDNLPFWVPNNSRDLALALLKARARHRFRPFTGTTVLFAGTVRGDEERFVNTDGENGWSRLVKGPLERVEFAGDHSQIMREPLVAEVAAQLQRILSAQVD